MFCVIARAGSRMDLQDRAVTRDLTWGVPVPVKGFEHKVIYVWFDAVLGYISSGREWAAGKEPLTHGKNIGSIRKQNMSLLSAKTISYSIASFFLLCSWHGMIAEKNNISAGKCSRQRIFEFRRTKFSKSRGWGIDVQDFLKFFPADTIRYCTCRQFTGKKRQ